MSLYSAPTPPTFSGTGHQNFNGKEKHGQQCRKNEATRDNQAETQNIMKPKTKHRNTQTEKYNKKENRGNKYNNNETTKGNITIKTPTHEKKTEGQTKHHETKHEAQTKTQTEKYNKITQRKQR